MMELLSLDLLWFLLCVAIATYAQSTTGFAFSLLLLGLVSVLHLAAIPDAANAATVLSLVNAITHFRGQPRASWPAWPARRVVLGTSLLGVCLGVGLLSWVSAHDTRLLRALLGLTILGCGALLLVQRQARTQPSGMASFSVAGLLSGLLGGLFSSSGPPLVYQMYRQPLPQAQIRDLLLSVFAVNSVLRLALVLATGQFSLHAALLSACAIPVVYGVTRLHRRYPPRLSPIRLRAVVAVLLGLSGLSLLLPALLGG